MISTQTDKTYQYYGLSTDTVRPEDCANGSQFIEMDTGKVFFYDAENQQWIEFGA